MTGVTWYASDLRDYCGCLNRTITVGVPSGPTARNGNGKHDQIADLQSTWREDVVRSNTCVIHRHVRLGPARESEPKVGEWKVVIAIDRCETAVGLAGSVGDHDTVLHTHAEAWLNGVHIVRRSGATVRVCVARDIAGPGLVARELREAAA